MIKLLKANAKAGIKGYDGMNQPRDKQRKAARAIEDAFKDYNLVFLRAAPGLGKTFIGRWFQRSSPKTPYITISNYLGKQIKDAYGDSINHLKGINNYNSKEEFELAKAKADSDNYDTIYNPASWWHYGPEHTKLMIIDEVHLLPDFLLQMAGVQLWDIRSKNRPENAEAYKIPRSFRTDLDLIKWLESIKDTVIDDEEEYIKLKKVIFWFTKHPKNFFYERHADGVSISPIKLSKDILKDFFRCTKILCMSGTLTSLEIDTISQITGGKYKTFNVASPIDPKYVPIQYKPNLELKEAWTMKDFKKIADELKFTMAMYESENNGKRGNTLIHIPYHMQGPLSRYFTNCGAIFHTKATKTKMIDKFKEEGGILFGSGMAEGVDFPGDECSLIIIPKLYRSNITSNWVKKMLQTPFGRLWYTSTTIKNTIQRDGRGKRGINDRCTTIILDTTFRELVYNNHKEFPKWFRDRIQGL